MPCFDKADAAALADADDIDLLAGLELFHQNAIARLQVGIAGTKFVAGQQVSFSGSASDAEDGGLSNTALTWTVQYITGGVVRPFVDPFGGQPGGTFTPETVTPYLGTDAPRRWRRSCR